jgi:hypothetical protein
VVLVCTAALVAAEDAATTPAPEVPLAGQGGEEELLGRIALVLDEVLETTPPSIDSGAERLEELGEGALPVLFSILRSERLPCSPEQDAEEPRVLHEAQRHALLAGVERVGRTGVLAFLEEVPAEAADPETHRAALAFLGAAGRGEDLRKILELAAVPEDPERLDLRVVEELEAALTRILDRDASSLLTARRLVLEQPESFRFPLLRAFGASRAPSALDELVDLLGTAQGMELVLLSQIGKVAARSPWVVGDHHRTQVGEYLWHMDRQCLREAALAVGRLEDHAAIPRLIELLSDENEAIRDSAHWALCEITGLELPPVPDRWRIWLQVEAGWFEERGAHLLDALDSAHPRRILPVLNELAEVRYQRPAIAWNISALLDHLDTELRRCACAALGRLGSPSALMDLAEAACGDPEEAVREEALQAIRAIKGWEETLDPEEWARLAGSVAGPPSRLDGLWMECLAVVTD